MKRHCQCKTQEKTNQRLLSLHEKERKVKKLALNLKHIGALLDTEN